MRVVAEVTVILLQTIRIPVAVAVAAMVLAEPAVTDGLPVFRRGPPREDLVVAQSRLRQVAFSWAVVAAQV